MKIKQQPSDFVVDELAEFTLLDAGPYFLYRLNKCGISTHDVLDRISALTGVPAHALYVCGPKASRAETAQFLTARDELHEIGEQPGDGARWSLTNIGRTGQPILPQHVRGHRFAIVVRDLTTPEYEALPRKMSELAHGLVNYYDSQRFATERPQTEFVAKALIRGETEHAVRLSLTSTADFEPEETQRLKRDIDEHWGDWHSLATKLPRCPERPVVRHLMSQPDDFLGAFMQIDRRRRTFVFFAYQSYLWNEVARRLVEGAGVAHLVASYRLGEFAFHIDIDEALRARWGATTLPLLTHTTEGATPELEAAIAATLEIEGVKREQFEIAGAPSLRFNEIDRRLLMFPRDLQWDPLDADELHEGALHGRLSVTLPAGAYATLVLKRLLQCRRGPHHPDADRPPDPGAAGPDVAELIGHFDPDQPSGRSSRVAQGPPTDPGIFLQPELPDDDERG